MSATTTIEDIMAHPVPERIEAVSTLQYSNNLSVEDAFARLQKWPVDKVWKALLGSSPLRTWSERTRRASDAALLFEYFLEHLPQHESEYRYLLAEAYVEGASRHTVDRAITACLPMVPNKWYDPESARTRLAKVMYDRIKALHEEDYWGSGAIWSFMAGSIEHFCSSFHLFKKPPSASCSYHVSFWVPVERAIRLALRFHDSSFLRPIRVLIVALERDYICPFSSTEYAGNPIPDRFAREEHLAFLRIAERMFEEREGQTRRLEEATREAYRKTWGFSPSIFSVKPEVAVHEVDSEVVSMEISPEIPTELLSISGADQLSKEFLGHSVRLLLRVKLPAYVRVRISTGLLAARLFVPNFTLPVFA